MLDATNGLHQARDTMDRPISLLLLALGVAGCPGTSPEAARFELTVENISPADGVTSEGGTYVAGLSPGALMIDATMVEVGAAASPALETLAEEGDPVALLGEGALPVPESFGLTYEADALEPGDTYRVEIELSPGQRAQLALMYGDGNDILVATPPFEGFAGGVAIPSQEISAAFFDAGTEVNEVPGFGDHQIKRGSGGEDEGGVVHPLDDGFSYPAIESLVRIRLTLIE